MPQPVHIAAARRTPIGKLMGGLSRHSAAALGARVLTSLLEQTGTDPALIEDVVMGQVLTAATGQNPARQAALSAGIPVETPAMTLNLMCGSGLRAVALGAQSIASGAASRVLAGGQESMSQAPHAAPLREGQKMGAISFVDTMLMDGLTDAIHGGHMGAHTEGLAARYGISRAEQEAFALSSQRKCGAAIQAGRFTDEITPVTVSGPKGTVTVAADEFPRPNAREVDLARLKPAFTPDGSITAATASGVNDGAAAALLMSETALKASGLPSLGRITAQAVAGVAPQDFGIGPVPAIAAALKQSGWRAADLDLVELNEAYAAQSLAVLRDSGIDPAITNVNGGAIALGHPIGASGARILATLLHEMARRDAKRGLASLCIGGGMGIALCVERD